MKKIHTTKGLFNLEGKAYWKKKKVLKQELNYIQIKLKIKHTNLTVLEQITRGIEDFLSLCIF